MRLRHASASRLRADGWYTSAAGGARDGGDPGGGGSPLPPVDDDATVVASVRRVVSADIAALCAVAVSARTFSLPVEMTSRVVIFFLRSQLPITVERRTFSLTLGHRCAASCQ